MGLYLVGCSNSYEWFGWCFMQIHICLDGAGLLNLVMEDSFKKLENQILS